MPFRKNREQAGDGFPGKEPGKKEPVSSHVIYEVITNSPVDKALARAAHQALLNANFGIGMTIEGRDSNTTITVRTVSQERKDQSAEAALFLGLTEAVRIHISKSDAQPTDISAYQKQANEDANSLLFDFIGKKGLYEEFKEYYGGMRWGMDQERFVRTLFKYGTPFEPTVLDRELSSSDISTLLYMFKEDGLYAGLKEKISYKEYSTWHEKNPKEIFQKYPQLDYHKLQNEAFRNSQEGQELLEAYQHLSGHLLAQRHHEIVYKKHWADGSVVARPLIPLSKHPIIEALMVNELALDRPKQKYDFGPRELTEVVIDSDSKPAHDALITAVITRLPKEHRHVIDGPSEFDHKHRNINSILHRYREACKDNGEKELLRVDVLRIMDAFTGNGVMAKSVREENEKYREQTRNWRGDEQVYDTMDVTTVKEIVHDLLQSGVTSPDAEIVEKSAQIIGQFLPDNAPLLGVADRLALTRGDLMLMMIDSLKEVDAKTDVQAFEQLAGKIFGDKQIGKRFGEFARTSKQIIEMYKHPGIVLFQQELRKFGFSLKNEKSKEEIEVQRVYDELTRPVKELSEANAQAKNKLLIELLHGLVSTGALASDTEAAKLFKGIVDRIPFGTYEMHELPEEYYALVELGRNPAVPQQQKNNILWHIQKNFQYVDSNSRHLMVPVLLDMYELALGPVDNVRFPTKETTRGLSAANSLIGENRSIFKSATQEQLRTFDGYSLAVKQLAEQVASGALLPNGQEVDFGGTQKWKEETLREFEYLARELAQTKEHYREYQHLEATKVYPHIYYPWVLDQLVPFWEKLNWEVGPGNKPTGEIQALYNTIKDYVKHRLVIKNSDEYVEDFDVVEQGHIDGLLREGYYRMVIPHDIKYNSTVWREGLGFMHMAVSHMPESVFEQIKAKYENTDPQFVKYLEKERARWNKEEEVF